MPTLAQTTVNLTVQDTPDNQTWNNGTWSAVLAPPGLAQGASIISGGGSLSPQSGSLSGTGTASMSLPANTNIAPNGTTWAFTVCPQATSPCVTMNLTVSSSSPMSATLTPPSIRLSSGLGVSAYSSTEVSGGLGTQYYDLTAGAIKVCTAFSAGACTTWTASGGVPSQQVAPNPNTLRLSNNCGTQTNCVPTNENTQQFTDCSWTNASATVTCTGSHFTAAMVGWRIAGFSSCKTNQTSYTNSLGSQAGTTIATYVSATQVTASNNATGTQASAGCLYVGQPDDTGFATLQTDITNSTSCPSVELDAGIYSVTQPYLTGLNAACEGTPEISGASYSAAYGMLVKGKGNLATRIFRWPDFNWAGCTFGASGHACSLAQDWEYFGITGGGLNASGIATTAYIVEAADDINTNPLALFRNFSCTNLATSAANIIGMYLHGGFHAVMDNSVFDGCGAQGVQIGTSSTDTSLVMYQSGFQGSLNNQVNIASSLTGYGSWFQDGAITASNKDIVTNTGGLIMFGGGMQPNGNTSQQIDYHGKTGSSATFYGASILINSNASSQGVRVDAGSARAANSSFKSGGSGPALYLSASGTQFFDECGNTVQTTSLAAGSLVIGNCSVIGTVPAATNIALGAGFGTSPSSGSFVGNDQRHFMFTLTVGTGTQAQATSTVTYTFPTAFLQAPGSCHAQQIGGTNPQLTFQTTTLPTTTSVVFTPTAAATASDTIILAVDCQ